MQLRTAALVAAALVAGSLSATPVLSEGSYDRSNARNNQVLVRSGASSDARELADQYGLVVGAELRRAGEHLTLFEAPASLSAAQVEELLLSDPRVLELSRAQLASLPDSLYLEPAQEHVQVDLAKSGDFSTPCLSQGFSELLWKGYADQEAAREIRLHEGHAVDSGCGAAVVAVLDNGVDPSHPILAEALLPGYDFLNDHAGMAAQDDNLTGTVTAILEATLQGEGELVVLDGGMGLIGAGTVTAILETDPQEEKRSTSFFGHGTMVAGLVRLTAPAAAILPLRVFDDTGWAHVFDVIQAIYYAVDHGADVITMSFSMDDHSIELLRAIQYARSHGVVCVAAAGNQGEHLKSYPAAYPDVIGVAALDGRELTSFSNFGSHLVSLAAPGNGVISAYPGGYYGAGWGTSFAAPLVAGAAALLIEHHPTRDTAAVQSMEKALRLGSEAIDGLNGDIGGGRLDVYGTILEMLK